MVLKLLIRSAQKFSPPGYVKAIRDDTPNDLLGWMRQAAQETMQKPRNVAEQKPWTSSWRFGPLSGGRSDLGLINLAQAREQRTQPSLVKYPMSSEYEYLNRW